MRCLTLSAPACEAFRAAGRPLLPQALTQPLISLFFLHAGKQLALWVTGVGGGFIALLLFFFYPLVPDLEAFVLTTVNMVINPGESVNYVTKAVGGNQLGALAEECTGTMRCAPPHPSEPCFTSARMFPWCAHRAAGPATYPPALS